MMYLFRALLLCLPLATIATECQATRYFVNASATGSATGLTWADAFTNLQEALGIVIPGDEIWVAAGQYKPTTTTTRTISFQVRNGVDLYGGFAGNETTLEERDLPANPTILNGDIGEPGSSTDNSHTVVTATNITSTVVMDGFRIVNGYSASGSTFNGGGLRVTNSLSGEFILRNCSVINNFSGSYGGGLYLASARLTIENCDFNNNQAGSGNGGAIYNGNVNGSGSILTVRDCRFRNNSARVGACLANSQSYNSVVIDRCIFTANDSENSILVLDDFESAQLLNSYVIGNTVDGFSSNVLNVNSTTADEVFTMTNCTVAHNFNVYSSTVQAPMIRFFDAYHEIRNSIIHGNTPVNGLQVSSNADVFSSLVEGGHVGGTNIIDEDPLFTEPYDGAVANFDATQFDYSLSGTSPAVNSGNNAYVPAESDLDLALVPRIQAGTVDMGCYESDFTTALSTTVGSLSNWSYEPSQRALILTSTTSTGALSVFIHDVQGRLVSTATAHNGVVRLELSAGVHFATADGFNVLKFVVP